MNNNNNVIIILLKQHQQDWKQPTFPNMGKGEEHPLPTTITDSSQSTVTSSSTNCCCSVFGLFRFRCVFVLVLGLSVLLSAVFWLPMFQDHGDLDLDDIHYKGTIFMNLCTESWCGFFQHCGFCVDPFLGFVWFCVFSTQLCDFVEFIWSIDNLNRENLVCLFLWIM